MWSCLKGERGDNLRSAAAVIAVFITGGILLPLVPLCMHLRGIARTVMEPHGVLAWSKAGDDLSASNIKIYFLQDRWVLNPVNHVTSPA